MIIIKVAKYLYLGSSINLLIKLFSLCLYFKKNDQILTLFNKEN